MWTRIEVAGGLRRGEALLREGRELGGEGGQARGGKQRGGEQRAACRHGRGSPFSRRARRAFVSGEYGLSIQSSLNATAMLHRIRRERG